MSTLMKLKLISTHFLFKKIILLILGIALSPFSVVQALESEEFEARYRKLSNELRCPTCQGLSVKDSEAGFSNSIKEKIRELLKEGKSDTEVKAYFIKRYGEWILRAPSKKGFNLLLWVLPGILIVFGLGWIMFRSKKWVDPESKKVVSELTPDEERKVMEDLERFDKS